MKKLLKTRTSVLVCFMKNAKESEGEEHYKNEGKSNLFIDFVTFEWIDLLVKKGW